MSQNYPTGVLEGLSSEELAEYYALWDRLRGDAISDSDRPEIYGLLDRAV